MATTATKIIIIIFWGGNFKSLQLRVSTQEKESEKKKGGGGGLKPAVLVSRNVTTQVPSNNISSNLRSL